MIRMYSGHCLPLPELLPDTCIYVLEYTVSFLTAKCIIDQLESSNIQGHIGKGLRVFQQLFNLKVKARLCKALRHRIHKGDVKDFPVFLLDDNRYQTGKHTEHEQSSP